MTSLLQTVARGHSQNRVLDNLVEFKGVTTLVSGLRAMLT